jgi:subtilisin family serine protease
VGVELGYLRSLLAVCAGAFVLFPTLSFGVATAAPDAQSAERHPVVAIIDSGIARTPEIGRALVAEYDMAVKPGRPAFHPRYDHGTMVATILLREAKEPIDIVSLRVDDLQGCPEGAHPPCQHDVGPIVDAIRKATDLGVSVINISLNLKDDPRIVDAVKAASKRGIAVVLAAGNDGADRPGNLGMAKAGFPNTVLVGALDAYGHPWQGTNKPEAGDPGYRYVWQRGVEVPTELADGSQVFATGTSFAAPIETARLAAAGKRT